MNFLKGFGNKQGAQGSAPAPAASSSSLEEIAPLDDAEVLRCGAEIVASGITQVSLLFCFVLFCFVLFCFVLMRACVCL